MSDKQDDELRELQKLTAELTQVAFESNDLQRCHHIQRKINRHIKSLIRSRERAARIEERQFAFELVNDVRYQNKSLDGAKKETLERLIELQVEAELQKEEV